MNEIIATSMVNFFQTSTGKEFLQNINFNVVSAAQYYMGVPNGSFFTAADFDESVVKAKKAYITMNTIMGGDSSEMVRFSEGKKQIPGLLTPLGVKKMVSLFTYLYFFASESRKEIHFETVRACRQSEISEGESIVKALTSTTKLSVDEIMDLGYGNKNGLAICRYKFHKGAVVFDMEDLGNDYLKPEEREVLLLMGNKLISHCCGYDNRYLGKDGQPAMVYEVDVYPPIAMGECKSVAELETAVYDEQTISQIQQFYIALNTSKDFPEVPPCYRTWKENFQKLVFHEVGQLV